jgi:pimeloyl-ACP methyl ester carboxylesterase
MPRAKNGSVELEYEAFGAADAPAILLINGLGSQMTRWPADFCERLAGHGYRVIRFDNRDVGKSTWFKAGDAYSLSDMAADATAVLDAVGVRQAHVAGMSMGGMIAQLVAIEHPGRVLSLTSIMSATGAPGTMDPAPSAGAVLTAPAPDPAVDLEAFLAHGVKNAQIIGSPGYPVDDAAYRQRAIEEYERAFTPTASQRQMAAIRGDGDRTERLGKLKVPTVVLHGADDPLVQVVGGEATAKAIPGAELRVIPGMGHNLPPSLYDTFIDAILAAAARA